MDLNKEYYLLLIDVIQSTQILKDGFNIVMNDVDSKLIEINKDFKSDLVLPISVNYGDEIAGLFKTPMNIYRVVKELRRVFHPITTIRFVAVKGTIARISPDIRQVGGEIFKKASQLIEVLKKKDNFCAWRLGDPVVDKTLESLCKISNLMLNNMSDYQRNVYELYNMGLAQKQIAEELEKHAQSIWDAIQRSNAYYVIEAEGTADLVLDKYKWK